MSADDFTMNAIAHRLKSNMPQGLQTGLGSTYVLNVVAKELELMYSKNKILLESIEILEDKVFELEERERERVEER